MTNQLMLTFPVPVPTGIWPDYGVFMLGGPHPRRRTCACRHSSGDACALLDGREGDVAQRVGVWVMTAAAGACPGVAP